MNIALFAYNFPHKKTQDVLLQMILEERAPKIVLAADPVSLDLPKSTLRVKPRFTNLMHPAMICERFDIPYVVVEHNAEDTADLLRDREIDVGMISGARILKEHVIRAISTGIVNFHPALLPDIRGLDSLKWSIVHGVSPGVTAHLIDYRVDAGRVVRRESVPVYQDDTFIDISLRLHEKQLEMIAPVFTSLEEQSVETFDLMDLNKGRYCKPMSADDEARVLKLFEEYKRQRAST